MAYRDWRRVLKRAGLDDLQPRRYRLHDLRHWWAVQMLMGKVASDVEIAQMGGWGSLTLLRDRYGFHVQKGKPGDVTARFKTYRRQLAKAA